MRHCSRANQSNAGTCISTQIFSDQTWRRGDYLKCSLFKNVQQNYSVLQGLFSGSTDIFKKEIFPKVSQRHYQWHEQGLEISGKCLKVGLSVSTDQALPHPSHTEWPCHPYSLFTHFCCDIHWNFLIDTWWNYVAEAWALAFYAIISNTWENFSNCLLIAVWVKNPFLSKSERRCPEESKLTHHPPS